MELSKLLTLDIECYENYLLVMFRKVTTGQIMFFEKFNDSELNKTNIFHIINKYTLVTFNGIKYDEVVLSAALAGFSNKAIHKVGKTLIDDRKQPWQVRKEFGIARLDIDSIDLIEVAPLKASLKIYGGRIHCPKMQDLPLSPETIIQEHQLPLMQKYCGNDNEVTWLLGETLMEALELRIAMGKEYDVDLRSKSDAQIAEVVVKHEMETKYNITPKRPKIGVGTKMNYKAPKNLVFKTKVMQDILEEFKKSVFVVGKSGHMEFLVTEFARDEEGEFKLYKTGKKKGQKIPWHPIKGKKFMIGNTEYKIGIGGLHSCEKSSAHEAGKYKLKDYDVAAFYPRIILNNKLFPKNLGKPFLLIFESIVNRRIKAKKAGDTVVNESLKITINGTFGKLGSKWSFLYAPDLMLQVTITGQLSLLMLVERLELAGVQVVSGNTDGIVTKILPEQEQMVLDIISDWEFDTDYEMEETEYLGVYSRDVNNYIAVKKSGGTKGKGAFADPREKANILKINPSNEICVDAVRVFLEKKIPVEKTIRECIDPSKFVTIRTVNGGAVYEDQELGKAIRWYYGKHELDMIRYATNGNKVPRSDGAVPMMDLPNTVPEDIDFDWYITEANDILKKIGYTKLIQ